MPQMLACKSQLEPHPLPLEKALHRAKVGSCAASHCPTHSAGGAQCRATITQRPCFFTGQMHAPSAHLVSVVVWPVGWGSNALLSRQLQSIHDTHDLIHIAAHTGRVAAARKNNSQQKARNSAKHDLVSY